MELFQYKERVFWGTCCILGNINSEYCVDIFVNSFYVGSVHEETVSL